MATENDLLMWYGIQLNNGQIKVKRYFEPSYTEAGQSDFVMFVTPTFPAESKEQAMARARRLLGGL